MDDPGPASARYIERALKAIQGDKDAARDVETYSKKLSEARKAQHAAGYDLIIACGFTDVARMLAFLAAPDERRDTHASIKKFVAHVETSLDGNNGVLTTFERNVKYFWKLLEKYGQKIYAGAGLTPEDFVTKDWEKLRGNSHVAERRVLEFVLSADFEAAFLKELEAQNKAVYKLYDEAMGKVAARRPRKKTALAETTTTTATDDQPPTRRSAASAPAETTEAAETTPPKAKAPARRPRRRGRRREDDDDDDDFAPPPKAKAQDDDEIETAVGEAALAPAGTKTAELVDLMADNKMLQRDLATRDKEIADLKAAKQSEIAARDEEIAAARAEIAAYKEQIEEKEAESRTYVNIARDAKKELDAVKAELAREKDKNKAVSPLCDSTNIRLTSSAA